MRFRFGGVMMVIFGAVLAAHGADVSLLSTATRAEIQAALDSVTDGSSVTLPAGTYNIDTTISVTNNVKLVGAGMDKTILLATCAFKSGSFLRMSHKNAVVSGVTITNCTGSGAWNWYGQGAYITAGRLEYSRVTHCNSTGRSRAGAISVSGSNSSVSHCRVDHNTATSGSESAGGGILIRSGAKVDNCLVTDNTVGHNGGGISFYGSEGGSIVNCTVVNNSAGTNGGGIAGSGTVVNSLVWGNSSNGSVADLPSGGTVSHCASPAGVGTDPVSANPQFADAVAGDYRLLASSPCIDAGSDSEATAAGISAATDYYGQTRKLGSEIDIGCAEFDPDAPSCAFAADKSETLIGNTVTLTSSVAGFGDATDLAYAWTVTDADGTESTSTAASFPFMATKCGRYDVALTVSSESKELSKTLEKSDYFYVAPLTNYVTCAKGAVGAFPYGTVGTAATSIGDAVKAAIDGSVVFVEKGTHAVSSTVVLEKKITVVGEGMTNTIFDLKLKAMSPVFKLNHAASELRDLAIANAKASDDDAGLAVRILGNGGLMRRCRVTGATTSGQTYTSGAVFLNSSAARITHCLIDGNTTKGSYTGGGAIFLYNGLVDNTLVLTNVSGYRCEYKGTVGSSGGGITAVAGKVVNCTVVGNTVTGCAGGGIRKSTSAIVENCIVYDNLAPDDGTDPTVTGAPNLGGSTDNVTHCLVGQNVGTDPILGTPEFVNANTNNYRLAASSPCRDVGTEARYLELLGLDEMAGEVDLDGFTRLSGSKVDAGAYEYDASKVSCSFNVDKDVAFVPATFTLTPSVEGFADPEQATLTWTFTPVHGGKAIAVEQVGTNVLVQTLSSNEQYLVTLAGAGGGQQGSFTRADPIYAAAYTNFVTASKDIVSVFPYATPETAATNFVDAFEASVAGATVFVGEGTNLVRSTVTLEKAITIQGVSRDRSWLRAPTAYGPILYLNHADAVVRDLTIADGQAIASWQRNGTGAGVYIYLNGGTLADCRVTGCGLNSHKSGACMQSAVGAIYMNSDKAVVTRCVIDNMDGVGHYTYSLNGDSSGFHSGGMGVIASRGRIDNCVVSNILGVAAWSASGLGLNVCGTAEAINCTVISNCAYNDRGGAGVYATSSVRNTISANNFSYTGVETNIIGETYCSHCLSPTFTSTANGNIIGRPVFEKKRPLVLARDSPGQGRGSTVGYEELLIGGRDLLGHPRVRRVRSNGQGRLDIGCTESAHQFGCVFFVR